MSDTYSFLDYGEQLVMRYRASGLTRKEFAEQSGISVSTLAYYVRRERSATFPSDVTPNRILPVALGASFIETMKALELYLAKFHERPDKYQIVRTAADIDKAIAEDKMGVYFTHQGTDILEGDPERVSVLRLLGCGYCLLAYNSRNPVGDGAFEPDNGHLTIYGKAVIDAYNKYGMIVDVSHTGINTSLDAIERSSAPVISSHSGARAINDYPRCHTDEVTKALAQSGGVHCINTVGGFVDPTNPDIVSTDIIFKHIDHIVNLVGIDHVGYGSDFIPDVYVTAESGQTPLADAIFPDPRGGHMFQDMCKKGVPTAAPYQFIAALVEKMLEHGYSDEDCGKVIGGNVYRVFKQVWQ